MSRSDHLLAIAVGPVQEFIAASRKIRDLWCGSVLLSELSKAVAKSLQEIGCSLIFPAPQDPGALESGSEFIVANKILALLPSSAGREPKDAIDTARRAFEAFRANTFANALQLAMKEGGGAVDDVLFNRQVSDFGEFFAASAPVAADGYAAARTAVERLLAARKNLRDFRAPSWDGTGLRKCSLDGSRETVLRPGKAANLHQRLLVRAGEHLDAAGLAKRMAPDFHRGSRRRAKKEFDTLAEIALVPYLARIEKDGEAIALLEQFRERLAACQIKFADGLLIDGELRDAMEDAGIDPKDGKASAALEALGALHRHAKAPLPYACVLRGDGDHMGLAIGSMKDMGGHRTFSARLSEFASAAIKIVESHGGCMIYSGGDDVLAFLPLHTAVDCGIGLGAAFAGMMAEALPGAKNPPTFSAGIAIVHHSESISKALALAHQAERAAKEQFGRDALAIIRSKRSGSDLTVGMHWAEVPRRIQGLIDLFLNDRIGAKLAYDLRRAAAPWDHENVKWAKASAGGLPEPGSPLSAEVLRVATHKRTDESREIDAAIIGQILEGRDTVSAISGELIVAHQIAQAKDMAGAKP